MWQIRQGSSQESHNIDRRDLTIHLGAAELIFTAFSTPPDSGQMSRGNRFFSLLFNEEIHRVVGVFEREFYRKNREEVVNMCVSSSKEELDCSSQWIPEDNVGITLLVSLPFYFTSFRNRNSLEFFLSNVFLPLNYFFYFSKLTLRYFHET